MVTGAPGTGKTTLINDLLANLSAEEIIVARMNSVQMGAEELLRMVASSFGLSVDAQSKAMLMRDIKQLLVKHTKSGRRVLLVIDEAQALSLAALEELRLLSNFQDKGEPLLQVLLVGQEKLENMVRSRKMKRLYQRLIATCHIKPLAREETEAYIKHRLQTVGWKGDPQLIDDVFAAIHKFSYGIPRQINFICGRLLLLGYVSEKHTLDLGDIQYAIADLQSERLVPIGLGSDISVEPKQCDSSKSMHEVPRSQTESPTEQLDSLSTPVSERRNKRANRRVVVLMCLLAIALLLGVLITLNERVISHFPGWLQAEWLVVRILGTPTDPPGVQDKKRWQEDTETSPSATRQTLASSQYESPKGEKPETSVGVSPAEDIPQGPAIALEGDPGQRKAEAVTDQRGVGALLSDEKISSTGVASSDSRDKPEPARQQEVATGSRHAGQPHLSPEDDVALHAKPGLNSLGTTQSDQKTPNHDAALLIGGAKRGDIQTVESLLAAGIFPDSRETESGVTALMVAAKEGHLEVIKALLAGGADIDAIDNQDKSALLLAVENDHVEAVRLLLSRGASVNVTNKLGESALHYASWNGNLSIVHELVDGGANVNARNKEGWSSLINAAINGHIDLVKYLLKSKADPNISTDDGKTALMAAAWNGHSAVVQTLLENGAAVNAKSRDGRSALIYAAWNGYGDIVRALIASGANLKQRDNSLQTAAEIAAHQGHTNLAKFIEKAETKYTSNGHSTIFQ